MSNIALPTDFQSFIHTSRYARWIETEQRRESWSETVGRYIDQVVCPKIDDTDIIMEIRDAILSLEIMPSMRAMMTAGKALERDNVAGYNCFSADTEVVTKHGIRKFKDLQIGIYHTVLAGDGEWRKAIVNSFGTQPVYKVILRHSKKSGVKSEVTVTKDHRWITENRGEVTDLGVGDTVRSNVAQKDFDMIPEAWISGFGFGDGTIDSRGRAKVRLCGDKNMRHVGVFVDYGNCSICYPPSYDGDAVVIYRNGFFEDWKKLPYHKTTDPAWLSSWITGYIEADGHNNPKQPGLSSQNQEALDFVQRYGPMCGYIITDRDDCSVMETNYGVRKNRLGRLTIRDKTTFYVESMEYVGEQEVFCFTEEVTHSFTLANGALTGNCSYLPVDDPKSFDEAMFILLCGTGVGFSVERQYVNKLPEVPDELFDSETTIVVSDSKEGWAKAYRQIIALLYSGEIPKWDVSKVRPAGAKLKTFGGRASGPGPLIDLFQFTIETFREAKGRKLSSIECHDLMCKIGETVVVGGVRRSAMISLSNLSDDRMRHAKTGQFPPHRYLANNSVAYTEKPDAQSFLREWSALADSGSGERGVFNRVASQKQAEKYGRRDAQYDFGTNPCCVSGVTPILTDEGYRPINETVGYNVSIWNGEDWAVVKPYEAGVADLYRVMLSDGTHLDCTVNHRWCIGGEFVETQDLMSGMKLDKFPMPVVEGGDNEQDDFVDAYSQGFYSGDGTKGYTRSWLYEPKFCCAPNLKGKIYNDSVNTHRYVWNHGPMLDKSYVPTERSLSYRLAWLAGMLDSDGTVTRDKNGSGFQIASVDHDFLLNLRLMLTTLGVRAKVVSGHSAGVRSMPDGRGGQADYHCRETRRILIGNYDAWHLMQLGLGDYLLRLDHNGNAPQRDARQFVKVTSVEDLGVTEMTYCFTEPKTSRGTFNGIVTGNSEIILRPYQFCNLTESVVRSTDTIESLERKVRVATILGTIQSTMTRFPYLRKVWQKNTEEERLLGVSLTGIMDNTLTNGKEGDLASLLDHLREIAVQTNAEWADKLGIERSTAITCVKPSGTVSQLVDSASGIHARHNDYYIRTVRGDNKDPLTQFMKDQGIPNEPCVYKGDTTTVFSFPVKAPEGAITRTDMTAIEQLEMWLTYQRHWCEHKPSVTVSVKKDEWFEVGAFVYEYFDEMSGVSFLPFDDHVYQQAPYQDINADEYEDMLTKMPEKINWALLSDYEAQDGTKSSQTFACVGSCEIVDLNA